MKLYLVQHGKSKAKEEDPERPLNANGMSDVKKVSNFLANYTKVHVVNILHSGKLRALQTAKIFAEGLNPMQGVNHAKELEPLSSPWSWVEKLSNINNDIMIIGHLPHLHRLSDLLLSQEADKSIIKFEMGGVICLEKNESGLWSICWMIIPQILP